MENSCSTESNCHPLNVDWLLKALAQLEQLDLPATLPSTAATATSQSLGQSKAARNGAISTFWRTSLLPQFKEVTANWWKVDGKTQNGVKEDESKLPSAQHSFLLTLSRLAFLLPECEHAEVAQTLADFGRSSENKPASASASASGSSREPWLTESTIKLVAQNLQYYDAVLTHSSKVDLLEWICDRMSAATVADATGFTGPLLHYLQDLLDDLYNLALIGRGSEANSFTNSQLIKEEKVALLYKISKLAHWISYLLGPRKGGRARSLAKVKDLEVVQNVELNSFSEDELSSETTESDEDDGDSACEEVSSFLQEEEDGRWSQVVLMEESKMMQLENGTEEEEEQFEEFSEDVFEEASESAEKADQAEGEDNSASAESLAVKSGSVAFEINLNSNSSEQLTTKSSSQPLESSKLKTKKLRLRRHVLRRLRRLCRNVRDDCDYQLKRCGY